MTHQVENPQFDLQTLLAIKNKIDSQKEQSEDYEKLDFFLSSINLTGYIKKNILEKGYSNYQNYIDQRKSTSFKKDILSLSFIEGVVNESISLLRSKFHNIKS